MMQLIGTSDQVVFDRVSPYEVRYLTYLARWAIALRELHPSTDDWNFGTMYPDPGGFVGPFPVPTAEFWDGEYLWKHALLSVWEGFSKAIAAKKANVPRPIYYAEKCAPWLPMYLKDVLPFRVIFLVRDPRDIFLSIKAFNKKRGYPAFGRRRWEGDMAFAKRWVKLIQKRVATVKSELELFKGMLIKYENLIANLHGETTRLGDWLNIRLNTETVEGGVEKHRHHITSDNPSLSVERWKREMPPRLRSFLTNELYEELNYFNYDVEI